MSTTGRRSGPRALLAVVAAVVAVAGPGCASRPDPDIGQAQRVFVVALPGLGWDDVSTATMPNLAALAERSAVGNLANRLGRSFADLPSAYLTMGAGTRAVAGVPETGVALRSGETVNGHDITELLGRRTDPIPPGGLAYLAAGPTADVNRLTVFGADVGMLGDHLATAGVHRGVVANGDEIDELQGFGSATITTDFHREAAAMLMGSDGIVPSGEVSQDLLERDPTGPLGVRYDVTRASSPPPRPPPRRVSAGPWSSSRPRTWRASPAAVPNWPRTRPPRWVAACSPTPTSCSAASSSWRTGPATPCSSSGSPRHRAGRRSASPSCTRRRPTAGSCVRRPLGAMATSSSPTWAPRCSTSSTSRRPAPSRDGPVMLTPRPAGAIGTLADDIDEAEFRDEILPAVTAAFILANAVLLGLAAWRRWRADEDSLRTGRLERLLRGFAFTILGTATATFLVGADALTTTSPAAYVGQVVAIGLVLGLVASAVDARRPGLGCVVSLAVLVGVVAADVLAGASLQVNTSFGYSVAVAGRFTGLGNLAFSLFGAASLLLAVLVAQRWGRRGLVAAGAVLAAALLVDGFPLLGADVGGTLTLVPAFALAGAALAGVKLKPVHVVAAGLLGLVVTLAFAAADLARPEHLQTHLARFARLLLDQEWSVLVDSVGRRLQASFGGVETGAWLAVGRADGGDGHLHPPRRPGWPARSDCCDGTGHQRRVAAAVGLGVLGAIGWVANDSSIAVPATMMIVVVPVLVDRVVLPAHPRRRA